jgi:hypothetical protein
MSQIQIYSMCLVAGSCEQNNRYPCLVSYWLIPFCMRSNRNRWGEFHSCSFTLLCERTNRNWWVVLGLSPVFLYKPKFGKQVARLSTCLMLHFCLAYFLTLTSINFQWTIWHYISEDGTFQSNKPLGSNKGGKFLVWLSNYQLLMELV